MVLALAIHTVPDRPSAKVPLSMIALLDLINPKSKGKGTLSPDLKCRMVFPTSGQRSTSLWDVTSIEALQSWLDEELDCQSVVYEVQEDFTYGTTTELTRVRAAERVSNSARAIGAAVGERTKPATDAASAQMHDMDSKYRISQQSAAALKAAQDTSAAAARNTAAALSNVSLAAREQYTRALQNERVAAAAKSAGQVSTQLTNNLRGWWGGKQGSPTSEGSEEALHSSQQQAAPVHLSGFSSASKDSASKPSPARAQPSPAQPADSGDLFTLGGLDGDHQESPKQVPAL